MTPDPALDTAIRQARHLLFAFNGPIHTGNPDDPTTPAAPYIGDAAAACRDSGRSFVVISTKPQIDMRGYLAAHDLFTHVVVIAVSVRDAANYLQATSADCLLVTSSAADIRAARTAGTPSIGYARTPDDAARLVDTGATAFVYSLLDLVLTLRARSVD